MPYLTSSSPGPSELGTITVTAVLPDLEAIFVTTWEWPCAVNPSPPYSFGITIPKNWRYIKGNVRKHLNLLNVNTMTFLPSRALGIPIHSLACRDRE